MPSCASVLKVLPRVKSRAVQRRYLVVRAIKHQLKSKWKDLPPSMRRESEYMPRAKKKFKGTSVRLY